MSDAFADYAEQAIPRAVKQRDARVEARQQRLAEVRQERSNLHRQYRISRRQWIEGALQGPHGGPLQAMTAWLGKLRPEDAEALVDRIAGSAWLLQADEETRLVALTLIGERIIKIREAVGLAPFDDPLPGEPDNAYLAIRRLLSARPA